MKKNKIDRGYIPSAEEFNKKMHECIEYKKLIELKKHLKWFGTDIDGMSITPLLNTIQQRIDEIPEESITFDTQVHGQSTND